MKSCWKFSLIFVVPLTVVGCGGVGGSQAGGGGGGSRGGGNAHSVQHIIYMFQENRSFDSYFGQLNAYRTSKGLSADVDDLSGVPASQSANPAWDGSGDIQPFNMISACSEDITPSWNESHVDRNPSNPASQTSATMNGFAREAGGYAAHTGLIDVAGKRAMGYYNDSQLPFYYFMATQFATSDRFFSPMMSKSEPNHLYSYAATSQGWITVPQGQLSAPTIFNLLQNAGISWKIYYTDQTRAGVPDTYASYFSKLASFSSNIVPLSQYFTDLQNDTLPAVALIEAGRDSGLDEHPDNNVQAGAIQASNVINPLMASSSWSSSVFILTWDEGGGLYDHVPPMTTVNPDGIPPNTVADPNDPNTFGDNFTFSGFRLPVIVVSPFAKSGFVSHTPMDYTAILRFIETRFGLPTLTQRDAAQPDMSEFFDFAGAPNMRPPSPPAQPKNAPCYKDHLP